ncbi:MAG: hypothetical protein EPN97_17985 [Alphaproteobacteria bacterium]|nr:MAG: hypothetical protein EPN97_17985 [Alphaproteobacteria bacterium]
MARPNQSSIVPDCYLVMAKRRRVKDDLSGEFNVTEATKKMVEDIRKLARKHGETISIQTKNTLGMGVAKLKCDRHFANLVKKLSSVAAVEQERMVYPPNKNPKFNV